MPRSSCASPARLEAECGRLGSARRLWRDVLRFDRRVSGPPLHLERLDDRPIPPAAGEIRLFTRLRNEHLRLPWLFDFYRGQGVDRFFVVDNGSDDGSRDYLLSRPDTHLYLTTNSYAVFGGGMRWLNHLLDRHGTGAWCLTVDVDEVLAYPHAEFLGLKQLTAHLDRQGAQGLFTFMLDMYAEGSLQGVAYRPGDNPLALCPCFDRAGYIHREHPDFPFKMVAGGLVSRFLYDRRQDGVFLHKVPLVRWQEELRYTSSTHTIYPIVLAQETGILLDLRAASAPIGLLDLLGLASAVGPTGRALHALSLADLAWPTLDAIAPSAPLLINLSGPLGLARAGEQLCIEELIRRAANRPVRLVLGGLGPSPPGLQSRLLDAVLAHQDIELWLGDSVSWQLAVSLLGRGRVRLVSPPLLTLASILRELTEREPIQPAMLGRPEGGHDLALRMAEHATWRAGFDPEATRRLGLALARVMGPGDG